MQVTKKSEYALLLGQALGFLEYKNFGKNYSSFRKDIYGFVHEIGFNITLPETYNEFIEHRDEILRTIRNHVNHERIQLGGDVYILTFFMLGRILYPLISTSAFGQKLSEDYLMLFGAVLQDLGIEDEFEDLKNAFQIEIEWLKQDTNMLDGTISVDAITKAYNRLLTRVMTLWELAKKSEMQIQFSRSPFYSVFISYSTSDQEFCDKLFDSLNKAGIQVWYAPHDIKPGQKIHSQVTKAIQHYDKLLLVLSDNSMSSEWVQTELYHARQRELKDKKQHLFPVSLVSYQKIKLWSAFDADTGRDMAREIREYYIPDFSDWKDEKNFSEKVRTLILSLVETEKS